MIVQETHEIRFTGPDGQTELQGWYILPVGYEEGKRYPLAFNVHGNSGFDAGNQVSIEVGGKLDTRHDTPLPVTGTVRLIWDGDYYWGGAASTIFWASAAVVAIGFWQLMCFFASAAATVMTMMANAWPDSVARAASTCRQKANKLMFTEFSISSTPMRTAMALRRERAP